MQYKKFVLSIGDDGAQEAELHRLPARPPCSEDGAAFYGGGGTMKNFRDRTGKAFPEKCF